MVIQKAREIHNNNLILAQEILKNICGKYLSLTRHSYWWKCSGLVLLYMGHISQSAYRTKIGHFLGEFEPLL